MIYHPSCDLHIHSLASGHAFNTIDEIICYSQKNSYKIIGISDHGPDMEGAPHSGYFEMLYRLPEKSENMMILYGCEANIIDLEGNIDLPDNVVSSLDFILSGLHRRTSYCGVTKEEHTKAIISAIASSRVDIISHPISMNFLTDTDKIIDAASAYGVAVEANKTVMLNAFYQKNAKVIKSYFSLLTYAEKKGVPILFGSDAHHISEMGLSEEEMNIITNIYEVNYSQLLNNNVDELAKFIGERKRLRCKI